MSFDTWIIANEPMLRGGLFIGLFLLIAVAEWRFPRRSRTTSRRVRWGNNIGLVILNTLVVRLVMPITAVAAAVWCADNGWGLLQLVEWPQWFEMLLAVILLDLAIWIQHVVVHAVPLLWRLHRVHHADLDYDLTTGARFHPIEIILSMWIKLAAIALIGPSAVAVVLFEVILNGMAMFNHANLRLPPTIDRLLRLLLVTPDMHRVHHSVDDQETNSNFGFNLSLWDRLFGTYLEHPAAGHEQMVIGLTTFRDPRQSIYLPGMLILPLQGAAGDYTINHRRWRKNEPEEIDRRASPPPPDG
jgi:sterol desaturase/sphingolipid hydroxylase (fatty acid hydroxylase superfamily)